MSVLVIRDVRVLWARVDRERLARLGHQMVKYETYLVPTLAGMDTLLGRYTRRLQGDRDTRALPAAARRDLRDRLGRRFFVAGWRPRDFVNWRRGLTHYHAFIRDLARLGGRVLVGTDCLSPCPGFLYHEELARLAACGLPTAAVLRAATAAAADTLGHRDLGRIVPGAAADLVLVRGNPFQRLADTRAVALVVARGRVFDPRTLLTSKEVAR